jgi:hypothetical protein
MNRRTWIGLSLAFLLGVSVFAYAQGIRQPAPAVQPGPYQFLVKPQTENTPRDRASLLNPEAASLYRCNTVTGEVEILIETSGTTKEPQYRWWRVSIQQ